MRLPLAFLCGVLPVAAFAFEPGSLGDHYRDTGHVQGCTEGGELPGCTIIAGGSQFVVAEDGPTPPEVMAQLKALPVLSYVEFRGDILNVNDSYADFALGAIAEADPAGDTYGDTARAMQGDWVDEADPQARVRVEGLIWSDLYAGEVVSRSVIFLGEGCADGTPAEGVVMELFTIGSLDAGSLCFSTVSVREGRMEMTYVPPGKMLSFARAE